MLGCLLLGRGSSQLEATKDMDTKLEDECARIARDVVPGTSGMLANRHDHACLKVLCRPLWEQPSRLNCAVEELDSQATQALSEVARDQDAKHSKDHADWLEAWIPHQLSWTRWAQSLSVLPREFFCHACRPGRTRWTSWNRNCGESWIDV